MATPSQVNLWNDITLRSTGLLLEDILERAVNWDERPDGERLDMYLEWEALVDRLHGTIEDDQDGQLTSEQRQRLRELARAIVPARKIILRIGLVYPDLAHVLDDVPLTDDERINHEIVSLHHWAMKLRSYSDFWSSPLLKKQERQAFVLEWDNAIDRLIDVEQLASSGQLGPEARADLRQVADDFTALLPTMRRLNLRLPDLDALERARMVEAA
jgi:hypothetical protein